MYNFKKNTKLYIVENGNKYPIDVYSDISASQTFDEQNHKQKTLHRLHNLHDTASITNANPANFSFTSPINGCGILLSLGTEYSAEARLRSFDIYIESDYVIYKIQNCIIENTVFNIERTSIVTISISGTGSKLYQVTNIPGVEVPEYTREYIIISSLQVEMDQVLNNIAGIHIEYSNSISWIDNTTLHESLTGEIAYPDNYVLTGRKVSGSITQFLTNDNLNTMGDTSRDSSLNIIIGDSNTSNILSFRMPSIVYTRRLNYDELINRVYDFRVNTNSGILRPDYIKLSYIYDRAENLVEDRLNNNIQIRS